MDNSIHEDYLAHPLKPKNKELEIAVPFLTGYNGIFNIKNKNIKFHFTKSINDKDFSKRNISSGAYKIEPLGDEKKRNIIAEGFLQKLIIHIQ